MKPTPKIIPDASHAVLQYRVGELFCGPGGLALGAHQANVSGASVRHVWATDYDEDACKTFRRNLPGITVICKAVDKLDFSILAPIDGLAFGFPCNDFSHVGERRGTTGKFGGLYIWAVRALRRFRPLFFVAENVSGIKSTNDRKDFATILNSLRKAGYTVTHHLYKLEEYGVPQTRRRIFIVGFRSDLGFQPFQRPEPVGRTVSCREALEKPPILPGVHNHELTRQTPNVVKRLRYIKPGQNAFNARIPPTLQLNVKGAKISQIYRRLDPDKPAYTVTGSGGGGTHIYHWEESRALTNRERARLQTFPDDFVFIGGKESVRGQIGMAVPPRFSRVIFERVIQTLVGADAYPQT